MSHGIGLAVARSSEAVCSHNHNPADPGLADSFMGCQTVESFNLRALTPTLPLQI